MNKLLASACLLVSMTAYAGYDQGLETEYLDGLQAYKLKDFATARKIIIPLADKGDAGAQLILGKMYGNGQGVAQDDKEAVKWFRLAADQGDADAQFNLGVMYKNGRGVAQDDKEAVKWFQLAADQDDADAQSNLGVMYDLGRGAPQNFEQAVKWYRLAAEQGHATAQYNLGMMYYSGRGVPRGYGEALKWCRLAAEQGHAKAQFYLGEMYANGRGVPQSRVMAFALFNVAAANDPSTHYLASANLEKLSSSMAAAEIAEGLSLSREMLKPGMMPKILDR